MGHAREDELREEGVDIFAWLEAVETGDLLVQLEDSLDQRVSVANHVDTMSLSGDKNTRLFQEAIYKSEEAGSLET